MKVKNKKNFKKNLTDNVSNNLANHYIQGTWKLEGDILRTNSNTSFQEEIKTTKSNTNIIIKQSINDARFLLIYSYSENGVLRPIGGFNPGKLSINDNGKISISIPDYDDNGIFRLTETKRNFINWTNNKIIEFQGDYIETGHNRYNLNQVPTVGIVKMSKISNSIEIPNLKLELINNDTSHIVVSNLSENSILWFRQDIYVDSNSSTSDKYTLDLICPILNKDREILGYLTSKNNYNVVKNKSNCTVDLTLNFYENKEKGYNGYRWNKNNKYVPSSNNKIVRRINSIFKFNPAYNGDFLLGNLSSLYSSNNNDLFNLYKSFINTNSVDLSLINNILTTLNNDTDISESDNKLKDLLEKIKNDTTNKEIISDIILNISQNYKNTLDIDARPDGSLICNVNEEELEIDVTKYDYVIVGAGPSGIMTAYKLNEKYPNKKILLLEKSEYSLQDYKNEGYDNIFKWNKAQNDPNYQYVFTSEDEKTIWLGEGIGGGSLVFGLQYIDHEEVVKKNHKEWHNYNEINIVDEVNNIIKSVRYSYNKENDNYISNKSWNELKEKIDSSNKNNIFSYNNKVYSKDLESDNRLLLGDLIKNKTNITIKTNVSIRRILYTLTNDVNGIEDFNGTKYYGEKYILTSGAIQSPAILQRSNIDCGDNLCDHGGFTIIYGKVAPVTTTTTNTETNANAPNFELNETNIGKINSNNTGKIIRIASGTQNGDDDKVYDFTAWESQHGGGAYNISNHTGNYVLAMPVLHNSSRWAGRAANFRTYIGTKNTTIDYNDLPFDLKSPALYDALFTEEVTTTTTTYVPQDLGFEPSKIISSLQTRDADLKWQTYYSTVPELDQYLILTHAQSTNLPCDGNVKSNTDKDENPVVTLKHLGNNTNYEENEYVNDLYEAYTKNDEILKSLGFIMLTPQEPITKKYIYENINSIYHYMGSCNSIVDENNKVNNFSNLYIGDISTLEKPFGGSTTFAALISGFKTAANL